MTSRSMIPPRLASSTAASIRRRATEPSIPARRRIVYEGLRKGSYYPWDFQPLRQASERYMRNHMDLNVLEATSRFPRAGDGE